MACAVAERSCFPDAVLSYQTPQVRYVNGEMFVYFFPDVPHGWGMKARIGGFPCANAYVGLAGWDRPVKFVSTQVAVIAQGNSATYGTG